jgi:RNA-directed DNA polymerase
MMVMKVTGATPRAGKYWKAIDWQKVKANVKRLQMRIAKAVREGKANLVKALQWLLSHSFSAKLLAVHRVTSNKGAGTPGVDGVIWNTPTKKMQGVLSLKRKGYHASPLKRTKIPKGNNKKRPLGIPIMKDRAMQALHLMTLEPVAETTADHNSYGFRPYRACRDAIGQCFCALAKSYSPKWVFDADIKACFDGIDHNWLLANIPMDKVMLAQWLKCGYMENKHLFPTRSGTPQGGIISPVLANMTLDGLEKAVREACPRRRKVNFIRYADDFIVTADTKDLLEEKVIPAIRNFLKPRGLELSEDKCRIIGIEQGFDFLGQHLRKYNNTLIITPSKKNIRSFLVRVKKTIKAYLGRTSEEVIGRLNPLIRGWCNYHRFVQSSAAFRHAARCILWALWHWAERKNPKKGAPWIKQHYFDQGTAPWVFACRTTGKQGSLRLLEVVMPTRVKLERYIKIKGKSIPFDPSFSCYFAMRSKASNARAI